MIIKIRVLKLRQDKLECLFSSSREISDSVIFDYAKVNEVLRCIFPKANIVEFSIM